MIKLVVSPFSTNREDRFVRAVNNFDWVEANRAVYAEIQINFEESPYKIITQDTLYTIVMLNDLKKFLRLHKTFENFISIPPEMIKYECNGTMGKLSIISQGKCMISQDKIPCEYLLNEVNYTISKLPSILKYALSRLPKQWHI